MPLSHKRFSLGTITFNIVAFTLVLLFLFPIFWMLLAALTPQESVDGNPFSWFTPPFTLRNIITIFLNDKVLGWMFNSVFVAIMTLIFTLISASMMAFALAQFRFPLAKIYYIMLLAGLMIPHEALLIPLFSLTQKFGLIDTLSGVIFPAVASPLPVIVLCSFFRSLPKSLFESALIDGASSWRIFISIALPLSRSSLVAVGIFTTLTSWNNFLWPYIVLFSEKLFTLPLGIPSFNNTYAQNYVLPMAVSLAASLPIIILFIIFERYIAKGISMTGIKG